MIYEDLLYDVYFYGTPKADRTGTGTSSIFGAQLRYDLQQGFPLITTKKVFFKAIAVELLWFLRGDTNVAFLHQHGVSIWDEWANEHGELGPVYGTQWRRWREYYLRPVAGASTRYHDQISQVVDTLRTNPDSRRMLVSAWNVAELSQMALAPCHFAFQCYVADGKLSLMVYQRSCDMFLGVPFNIASYALLTHMLAQQCNLEVGDLVWTGGDCHVYDNHRDQVLEQLSREPRPLPKLVIARRPASIFDYQLDDFEVVNYNPHPAIKAPVAV